MYELEATVDYNNLAFTFLKRSLPVYAVDDFTVKPGVKGLNQVKYFVQFVFTIY